MTTLYEKVMQIHPSLIMKDFTTTIILQNDSNGVGDYIKQWSHPTHGQPTAEQLAAIP